MRVRLSIAALGLACVGLTAVRAQSPDALAFEVASVRLNKSTAQPTSRFPLGPGDAYVPGNFFSATNQPLIVYLRFAFKLPQDALKDLPNWVYDEHFDISARAHGTPSKDEMRRMMRSLLGDRFKLKTHNERRSKPAFNLVLAKPGRVGPQLKAHTDDSECEATQQTSAARTSPLTEPSSKSGLQLPPIPCGALGQIPASGPGKGRIGGRKVTIDRIAEFLKNPFTGVDRDVFDRTGLTGAFDFSLEWSLEHDGTGAPNQAAVSGPDFFEALQSQLGFKLAATTAPTDVLVIDQIERPDQN